jgi:hypothetical protein
MIKGWQLLIFSVVLYVGGMYGVGGMVGAIMAMAAYVFFALSLVAIVRDTIASRRAGVHEVREREPERIVRKSARSSSMKAYWLGAIILVALSSSAVTCSVVKHITFAQAYAIGKGVGYKEAEKKSYSKGYDDGWARGRELLSPGLDSGGGYKSFFDQNRSHSLTPDSTSCTSRLVGSTTFTNCN